MELHIHPRHPAATEVGSSPDSHPDLHHHLDGDEDKPCACIYNTHSSEPHTEAACPYADDPDVPNSRAFRDLYGDAVDVTHQHIDQRTGRLIG
jgi:hypothetical protein